MPAKKRVQFKRLLEARIAEVSDNLWNATRGVAEDFIISLPAPTKIGLIAFASRPLASLGFDHSRKELLQTVHDLGTTGKDVPVKAAQTALWDSLIQTSELFGQPQPGDSVIVISDGGDNRSKAHEDSVGRLFVEKGIRLFAVDLHHQNFQTEEERQGLESLGWLAHVTGGLRFLFAFSAHFERYRDLSSY